MAFTMPEPSVLVRWPGTLERPPMLVVTQATDFAPAPEQDAAIGLPDRPYRIEDFEDGLIEFHTVKVRSILRPCWWQVRWRFIDWRMRRDEAKRRDGLGPQGRAIEDEINTAVERRVLGDDRLDPTTGRSLTADPKHIDHRVTVTTTNDSSSIRCEDCGVVIGENA